MIPYPEASLTYSRFKNEKANTSDLRVLSTDKLEAKAKEI